MRTLYTGVMGPTRYLCIHPSSSFGPSALVFYVPPSPRPNCNLIIPVGFGAYPSETNLTRLHDHYWLKNDKQEQIRKHNILKEALAPLLRNLEDVPIFPYCCGSKLSIADIQVCLIALVWEGRGRLVEFWRQCKCTNSGKQCGPGMVYVV